jgi:hypothetical protein
MSAATNRTPARIGRRDPAETMNGNADRCRPPCGRSAVELALYTLLPIMVVMMIIRIFVIFSYF